LISKEPQIIPTAVSVIRPSSPFGHRRAMAIWTTRLRKGTRCSPDPKSALNPCTKIDIPSEPIRLGALRIESIQRTFVYSHLMNRIKGMIRADGCRPPRRLRYGYTFERFVL